MIQKIKQFWLTSYRTDPFAFINEMASTILVIIGSAILTWTVLDPKPEIFIPFYWAGSIAGFIGAFASCLAGEIYCLIIFSFYLDLIYPNLS